MSDALAPAELVGFGLVAARLVPTGVAVGIASRGFVPLWLALAVAFSLAAGLGSGLAPLGPFPAGPAWLVVALLRELCVGLAFAVAALVPFSALEIGVRVAERTPAQGNPALSTLYLLAAAALTLALGGERAYLTALSRTLSDLPVAQLSLAREAWLTGTLRIVAAAFQTALALALPIWIALWLLDVTLALVARAVGEEGKLAHSPVRAALSLLVLGLAFAPLLSRTPELVRAALQEAQSLAARLAR